VSLRKRQSIEPWSPTEPLACGTRVKWIAPGTAERVGYRSVKDTRKAMSTLTLTLDPPTEQRVAEQARVRGMSETAFVRSLIGEALDDLEDIQVAADRLTNPLPPLSSAQARQALGLDD